MEQAFTAQNRGLLTMRGRLVLGHHPRLVLGGEATPGRPWRRIDRPRPVLLGRLLVAAHVRISSHALQANPVRRRVSQQPDREGAAAPRAATALEAFLTISRPGAKRLIKWVRDGPAPGSTGRRNTGILKGE